jgi:hypothetical protein
MRYARLATHKQVTRIYFLNNTCVCVYIYTHRQRSAQYTYTVFQFQHFHVPNGSLDIKPPCLIKLYWDVKRRFGQRVCRNSYLMSQLKYMVCIQVTKKLKCLRQLTFLQSKCPEQHSLNNSVAEREFY